MKSSRFFLKVIVGLAFVLGLTVAGNQAMANTVPPSPTNSFYGDATGDMIIAAADIAQMNRWMLGFSYTYDTIQPQFPSQDWNTSDVTSDALIAASDIAIINKWMLGFPVSVPDKPWALSNENLPLTNNIAGNTIPFQVNLASTDVALNTWGRAGLPVIAQIDPAGSTITGSLVGRTCAPIAGSRDQSTLAGDQCALSVTVTDWYGAPGFTKGLTETGTYGLSVIGNGTGTLRIVFSINSFPPGLDIPALSIGLVVDFSGSNQNPTITSTAPTTGGEGDLYSYPVIATDPDVPPQVLSCSISPADTCGGTFTGCTYNFTPGAASQTCVVGVRVSDDGSPSEFIDQDTTVTINRKATITSTPPTTGGEGDPYSYPIIVTDPDVPPQVLSCSVSPADTCGGSVVACVYDFTPGAASQNCVVGVRVSDDGSPSVFIDQDTTVTINRSPSITSSAPTTAGEGVLYSYPVTATDPDIPPQMLTCSTSPADTCGGTFTGCTYDFTPGAASQTCVVGVRVSDSGTPSQFVDQDTTITINRKATITSSAPTTAGEGVLYSYTVTSTDPDVPPQALSCSISPADTCGGSFTGCTYNFTPGAASQNCVVGVRVSDDGSPAVFIDQNTTVSINRNATFTTTAPTTAHEGVTYNYNPITITDTDTPAQTLTCAKSPGDTCNGVVAGGPSKSPLTCSYTFMPGGGSPSCVVGIRVTDSGSPAGQIDQDTTVTINRSPTFSSSAPITATEDTLYTYNIITSDPDSDPITLVKSGADTCGGSIVDNGNGTGTYTFTPAGPTPPANCVVGVLASDAGGPGTPQNTTVTITAVNDPPTVTLTCPASVTDPNPINCTVAYSDPESTPISSCNLTGADTCGGTLNGACNTYTLASSAGKSPSCVVAVQVFDSGSPAPFQSGTDSKTVTVNPPSGTVSINCAVPGPNPVNELAAMQCTVTATGGTPTINGATDTCGGTIAGAGPWTYNFTPTEAQGPGTCVAGVINGASTDQNTVTINEVNQDPYWTTQPGNLTVDFATVYNQTNGAAADNDLPNSAAGNPGYLTCTRTTSTCSFGVTVSGSGGGSVSCNMSFTAPSANETCQVTVQVADDYAASINKVITITVKNVRYITCGSTIQTAIDASIAGEEVWAQECAYDQSIVMKVGVNLYGGFAGGETSREQRNWVTHPTVIDGTGTAIHVVTGADNSLLDGFTITGGNATGGGDSGKGGGMINKNAGITSVANCIFTGNHANGVGGAMYSFNTTVNLTNVTFTGNSSNTDGGAIFNDNNSAVVARDVILSGNTATNGGAEYNKNNKPTGDTRINVIYSGNSATVSGGAIYNNNSFPGITNTTFTLNSAGTSGGAMYNRGCAPTILNSILWNDTAPSGPEMFNDASTPVVTYTDFQGGYAGAGNINSNPLFVVGPRGNYYLSQIAAGQGSNSPCVDTGNGPSSVNNMNIVTTRTDAVTDSGTVDMGFHYMP